MRVMMALMGATLALAEYASRHLGKTRGDATAASVTVARLAALKLSLPTLVW